MLTEFIFKNKNNHEIICAFNLVKNGREISHRDVTHISASNFYFSRGCPNTLTSSAGMSECSDILYA